MARSHGFGLVGIRPLRNGFDTAFIRGTGTLLHWIRPLVIVRMDRSSFAVGIFRIASGAAGEPSLCGVGTARIRSIGIIYIDATFAEGRTLKI